MKSFIQKISVPEIAQSRHLPGLKFLTGAGPGRHEGQSRPPGPGRDFSESQSRLPGPGRGQKMAGIPVDP